MSSNKRKEVSKPRTDSQSRAGLDHLIEKTARKVAEDPRKAARILSEWVNEGGQDGRDEAKTSAKKKPFRAA